MKDYDELRLNSIKIMNFFAFCVFEQNTTTTTTRRFVDLIAFEGTSNERSIRDLLEENDLTQSLSDDAIVRLTATPTPCPHRCKFFVTPDGECRHGFVFTPVEDLG